MADTTQRAITGSLGAIPPPVPNRIEASKCNPSSWEEKTHHDRVQTRPLRALQHSWHVHGGVACGMEYARKDRGRNACAPSRRFKKSEMESCAAAYANTEMSEDRYRAPMLERDLEDLLISLHAFIT